MKINVRNEYRTLSHGIIRVPNNIPIDEPINLVQAHYTRNPPHLPTVRMQHQAFEDLLTSAAVTLNYLPTSGSPFQIFTRDIGFTIGDRLFISFMKIEARRQEISALQTWLADNNISATDCSIISLEGGDVLVDYPFVYLGIGARTSLSAAKWLENEIAAPWRIVQVHTDPKVLHLDCVLNIIARDTIVYCPSLIGAGREAIEERYPRRIPVSEQEAFDMACNVLSLDESTLIVESNQVKLGNTLTDLGFRVRALDWSEIRKYGGLFRCAICPLERLS